MTSLDHHVHRWIPATQPDAPTLLLLHGTGGDERDLLQLGGLLYPGAALLSPRGNVVEHGAARFFRRLAEGVFDVEDLHRRTKELTEWLQAASARYGVLPQRTFAVGFSNGANIAASVLLSHPSALAGAVLFRAMVPFEPVASPELAGRPVLLSEGDVDPIIPPPMGERLASILRDAGADVELVWQRAGHQLTNADVESAQRWLAVHAAAGQGAR